MFAGKPGESPAFALKDKYFFAKTHCNKTTLTPIRGRGARPRAPNVLWYVGGILRAPAYHGTTNSNEMNWVHSTPQNGKTH